MSAAAMIFREGRGLHVHNSLLQAGREIPGLFKGQVDLLEPVMRLVQNQHLPFIGGLYT